jgi:hypothetical protein
MRSEIPPPRPTVLLRLIGAIRGRAVPPLAPPPTIEREEPTLVGWMTLANTCATVRPGQNTPHARERR